MLSTILIETAKEFKLGRTQPNDVLLSEGARLNSEVGASLFGKNDMIYILIDVSC